MFDKLNFTKKPEKELTRSFSGFIIYLVFRCIVHLKNKLKHSLLINNILGIFAIVDNLTGYLFELNLSS